MSWFKFKREADSSIQKHRQPIKNPIEFRDKIEDCVACLQSDPASAVSLAEALTEMEPERALPWFLLAKALGESGRSAEALEAINRAILIDPTDAEKWAIKAYALGDLNRPDEARSAVTEAKRLREREDSRQNGDPAEKGIFKRI